jgi:outer membrane protein
MKKVLLTVFAALTVFVASAQIEQGTWLVGASSNAGFTSYNEDAGDFSEFNINVKGGYFVIENLAVGLNLGYTKIDEASETTLGLFGRYYVNGKIFVGAGFNSTSVDFGIDGVDKATYSTIPLEVGYAAFLNNVVAIEPSVGYQIYGGDREGAAFGINVGISVYLGRGE